MSGWIKKFTLSMAAALLSVLFVSTAFGQSFSEYWYQDAKGWHIKDAGGTLQKNCWLCDDAVAENGKNIWYLIDGNGDMISAGLVQDGTGNYYSLEMNHNGYYGMLRYLSGSYTADGSTIPLVLESSHDGSFAAIKNADGIAALKAKYGLKTVAISNANIVYTSSFKKQAGTGTAAALGDGDFFVSGNDMIAQLKKSYSRDAAVFFFYDPSTDPTKEGVVRTARGITLGSSADSVHAAYGNPSRTGSCSSPSTTMILEIAYRNNAAKVRSECASYDIYYTANGSKAIMFTYDASGKVSYVFYYLV